MHTTTITRLLQEMQNAPFGGIDYPRIRKALNRLDHQVMRSRMSARTPLEVSQCDDARALLDGLARLVAQAKADSAKGRSSPEYAFLDMLLSYQPAQVTVKES